MWRADGAVGASRGEGGEAKASTRNQDVGAGWMSGSGPGGGYTPEVEACGDGALEI